MSPRLITSWIAVYIGFDPYALGLSFQFEIQRAYGVDIDLHAKVLGCYLSVRSNLIPPKGASVVGLEITPDDIDDTTGEG